MKKNWGGNTMKKFYSEMWETLFGARLVKIPSESSCMTVLQKLVNVFERIFGAYLIGFGQKPAEKQ